MELIFVLSDKDKKTAEVDDGVEPGTDKESQCSSSDLRTACSQGATRPTSAALVIDSSVSTDTSSSGHATQGQKTDTE